MKVFHSKGIRSNESSYLLEDTKKSMEIISIENLMHSIKRFTLYAKNILWVLSSNGNLYEHNFHLKTFEIIENCGQIQSYTI